MTVPDTVRHCYVHVPFCARRCSYCDFSIAVRATVPVAEYTTALIAELDATDTRLWHLDTLYLGGGTPSRLGGPGIANVLDAIRARVTIAPDAEITIEANPDDVTRDCAAAWRAAGVNRISLGVQSFHPHVLEWMHRTHSASQAVTAVHTLRDAGIENISVDLIFAVPPSLERNWDADLRGALALDPTHVSLYGLTVEPHTPLGKWRARGQVDEASDESYAADFLHAHRTLTAAGFEHYEVSNYGRPGRHSRHNSAYWRNVPYGALGPAAHRFDGAVRAWNVAPYALWVERLGAGHSPVEGRETLSAINLAAERVYLGLRSHRGLVANRDELEIAAPWVAAGWASITEQTIVLSPEGWLRLDALAAALTVVGSR